VTSGGEESDNKMEMIYKEVCPTEYDDAKGSKR